MANTDQSVQNPVELLYGLVTETEALRSYVNMKLDSIMERLNRLSAYHIWPDTSNHDGITSVNNNIMSLNSSMNTSNSTTNNDANQSNQDSSNYPFRPPSKRPSTNNNSNNNPSNTNSNNSTSNRVENKSFACTHCDKTYERLFSLQRHIKEFHESRKFQCETCGKIFARRYLYLTHVAKHQ